MARKNILRRRNYTTASWDENEVWDSYADAPASALITKNALPSGSGSGRNVSAVFHTVADTTATIQRNAYDQSTAIYVTAPCSGIVTSPLDLDILQLVIRGNGANGETDSFTIDLAQFDDLEGDPLGSAVNVHPDTEISLSLQRHSSTWRTISYDVIEAGSAPAPTLATTPEVDHDTGTPSNTVTATFPAAAIGQLALLFFGDERTLADRITTPTGWTKIAEEHQNTRGGTLFGRILDGTEDADITNGFDVTTTFANSAAGHYSYAHQLIDGPTAVPTGTAVAAASATATTVSCPAVTAASPLTLRFWVAYEAMTVPSGVTKVDEELNPSDTIYVGVATDDDNSVEAVTLTGAASSDKVGVTVGITA